MIGGGGAWRTLQPSPEDIEFAVSELGVRTVISLRAPAPGKSWYDAEAAACERLGVAFLSLGWSAKSVPDAAIDALIDAFRDHPGPYLLHCRAGKDRTSLAAAVYRHAVLGHPADEADDEMRLFPYGHSAVFGYGAIDEAWRRYVER